jgi:hypothetical protein
MFVMVKSCVVFEVRTEFLNTIETSFTLQSAEPGNIQDMWRITRNVTNNNNKISLLTLNDRSVVTNQDVNLFADAL